MASNEVQKYNREISNEEFNSAVNALIQQINSFNLNIDNCQVNYVPFYVDSHHIGFIDHESVLVLKEFNQVFLVHDQKVELNPIYKTFEAKTNIMEKTLIEMREKKLFTKLQGWRNEHYCVRSRFSSAPLFTMERSAVSTFGIRSYGCHINGYFKKDGQYFLWIARRSKTKPTFPGMLDNFVAGGLTAGYTLFDCAKKELEEEAGVSENMTRNLKQVDAISYAYCKKGTVSREGEFVFDIKLKPDFVPKNTDGEVECFYLMNVNQVKNAIINDEFKPNSAVVTLNFLMRKGIITGDTMPAYYEILENLHASGL